MARELYLKKTIIFSNKKKSKVTTGKKKIRPSGMYSKNATLIQFLTIFIQNFVYMWHFVICKGFCSVTYRDLMYSVDMYSL